MQQAAAPKVSFVSLGCPRDNECKLFEPPTPKEKCRPKAAFIWTINSSIGACPHVRNPSLAGRAPARTLTQKGGMIYVRLCVSAACCYLGQACSILDAGRRSMTTEGSEQVGVVTRPRSVVWYERLAWTALAVGLASAAANPAALAKYYHQYHGGNLILMAVSNAGQLLWIWLVARRRRNWARWISLLVILLGVLGISNMIGDIEEHFQLNPVATIFRYVAFAISIVSVMLLFRGDAREWFSRKRFASGA
jgi:hypothetical protein